MPAISKETHVAACDDCYGRKSLLPLPWTGWEWATVRRGGLKVTKQHRIQGADQSLWNLRVAASPGHHLPNRIVRRVPQPSSLSLSLLPLLVWTDLQEPRYCLWAIPRVPSTFQGITKQWVTWLLPGISVHPGILSRISRLTPWLHSQKLENFDPAGDLAPIQTGEPPQNMASEWHTSFCQKQGRDSEFPYVLLPPCLLSPSVSLHQIS